MRLLQCLSRVVIFGAMSVCDWQFAAAAEPDAPPKANASWQKNLEGQRFHFPEPYSGLLTSLDRFEGDVTVHILFDPRKRGRLVYEFRRDDEIVHTAIGHDQSAFISFGNSLFFAKYPSDATGCKISAIDLLSGELIWESDLHQATPAGHSGYRNMVTLRVSDAMEVDGATEGEAIVVIGRESYCDYVEVLDAKTGKSHAIKNYRVGFTSASDERDTKQQ